MRKIFDVEHADLKSPRADLGGRSLGEALLAPIREYVATHCFGQREGAIPTIAAAKLGNEAGIIGAAAL